MPSNLYDVMDLKALRCFWAVAKYGGFTQACIELGISEPAVSQRVKQLEQYLGAKLYEARGGRVRLTPCGTRTMQKAVAIFEDLDDFERTIESHIENVTITIATFDHALRYLLPDVVERFIKIYPRARLDVLARSYEDIILNVRTNEADMGIFLEQPIPKDLWYEKIASYPAYVILPKGHTLSNHANINFNSLLSSELLYKHPFIVSEDQLRAGTLKAFFKQRNLPLVIGFKVSTIEKGWEVPEEIIR